MHNVTVNSLVTGYFGWTVIHGISFEIKDPGVYVVLGKNGAGKTTLFRALTGILAPYSGYVRIDGHNPHSDGSIRRRIAFLSHLDALPEGLQVREVMQIFAEIEGVDEKRVEEVIEFLGIDNMMQAYTAKLSSGQRRKVSLAKSIMGKKDVYLMDEPTTGIDPKAASDIRDFILDLAREKIVLYSSHNLYEANDLGSRIIAIGDGELKYFGEVESLHKGKFTVGIRADNVEKVFPEAKKEGRYYVLELSDPDQVDDIIDRLRNRGIRIREVREMQNPLEKFFE